MTPDDIRRQRFSTRLMRGLSPEEVTAFLEDVAEAFDTVQRQNAALGAQIRAAEQKEAAAASRLEVLRTTALQEVEALLHDAQAQARALTDASHERAAATLREAEALKSQRQQEAEELVAGATATAESIIMAARGQEAALRHEIERLTESRLRLVDDVRATLDTYQEWLATVDPRGRAPGLGASTVLSEPATKGVLVEADGTQVG